MIDDFIINALLAGIAVALVAGPLGCVVVFGATARSLQDLARIMADVHMGEDFLRHGHR